MTLEEYLAQLGITQQDSDGGPRWVMPNQEGGMSRVRAQDDESTVDQRLGNIYNQAFAQDPSGQYRYGTGGPISFSLGAAGGGTDRPLSGGRFGPGDIYRQIGQSEAELRAAYPQFANQAFTGTYDPVYGYGGSGQLLDSIDAYTVEHNRNDRGFLEGLSMIGGGALSGLLGPWVGSTLGIGNTAGTALTRGLTSGLISGNPVQGLLAAAGSYGMGQLGDIMPGGGDASWGVNPADDWSLVGDDPFGTDYMDLGDSFPAVPTGPTVPTAPTGPTIPTGPTVPTGPGALGALGALGTVATGLGGGGDDPIDFDDYDPDADTTTGGGGTDWRDAGDDPFGTDRPGGGGGGGTGGFGLSDLRRFLLGDRGISELGGRNGILGGLLSGGLGYLGANAQADAAERMQNQYLALGAPSRARFEASYAPGFSMTTEPGYKDALDQASQSMLRKLAVQGNPYDNPGLLGQGLQYTTATTALPALQNYRGQLASAGQLGVGQAGQGSQMLAQNAGSGLNAIGYGANQIFNPPTPMEELLRQLNQSRNAPVGSGRGLGG